MVGGEWVAVSVFPSRLMWLWLSLLGESLRCVPVLCGGCWVFVCVLTLGFRVLPDGLMRRQSRAEANGVGGLVGKEGGLFKPRPDSLNIVTGIYFCN